MKSKKGILYTVAIILVVAIILAVYVLTTKMQKNTTTNISSETMPIETAESTKADNVVSTTNWNLNRVHIEYDSEGVPVPVPNGYVGSSIATEVDSDGNVIVEGENTVNTGFVIYEGTEEVTSANKAEAQATRNQWVWVPIYDASEIYGTAADGMLYGKSYVYNSSGRKLSSSSVEPKILESTSYNYDKDDFLPNYISEEEQVEFYEQLTESFEENIKSIEKYGGFYIGRYETGGISGEAKVVKGNTDISGQTWYKMYKQGKTLNGTNENVTTSMIWGCLWDATLEWFVDSECKTYEEVGDNSSSWGNYRNSTVSGKGSKRASGYSEVWKANNIYDMAGNVMEWTLEAYGTDGRYCRGGQYNHFGSSDFASVRQGSINPNYIGNIYIIRFP